MITDPRSQLVVGSKIYKTRENWRIKYPEAIGVDMQPGDGVDYVMDLEQELLPANRFDLVDCTSVLEHCRRPWIVADNIQQAMVTGGLLLVAVPFVWRIHAYPNDYWRFTTEAVRVLFPQIEWDFLRYEADDIPIRSPAKYKVDGIPYIQRSQVCGRGTKL